MTVGELIAELQAAGFDDRQIVTVVTLASRWRHAERDGAVTAAERARQYRARKSAAKANDVAASTVTESVTKRHEKRDADSKSDSDSKESKTLDKKKESKKESDGVNGRAVRGSRMPAGAIIPAEFLNAALQEGVSEFKAREWWIEFVDYWSDIPGQRGCKINWLGTWRNRVRDMKKRGDSRYGKNKPSLTEQTREWADEAREYERGAGISREVDDF